MNQIIGAIFQLILLFFQHKMEQNVTKKETYKKASDLLKEGIIKRDTSKITAGFAKLKKKPLIIKKGK